MAGLASGLPTGSQCATGFLSPARGARLCTYRLSQSSVVCSATPTRLSGTRTRKRLPFAARFASGKVVASVVEWAGTVEEMAPRLALFETGEASTAAVPAIKPAATPTAAKKAAMAIDLDRCIAAVGRGLLIHARFFSLVGRNACCEGIRVNLISPDTKRTSSNANPKIGIDNGTDPLSIHCGAIEAPTAYKRLAMAG